MVPNCQLLYIVQDGTVALKGSHRIGDGRIFSKNLRASLFYDESLILAGSISLDSTWEEDVKHSRLRMWPIIRTLWGE